MRLILGVLVSLSSLIGFAGGEGPCPLPDIPAHWIAEKTFHSASSPVRGMQSLEEDKSLLLKTVDDQHEVFPYDESGMCLTSPSFAVFSNPLTYVPIATMSPKPFPPWVESTLPVLKDGRHFFRAVRDDSSAKTRYRVVGIETDRAGLESTCRTPKIRNLKVSGGSIFPNVYFHAIDSAVRGARISLYHLDLMTCAWEKEASYQEELAIPSDRPLVRFGQGLAFVVPLSDRLIWRDRTKSADYKVRAKNVLSLSNNDSVLLVRDDKNAVSFLIPSLGITAKVMEDAVHFDEELVAASEMGDRVFIATSVQLPASSGIYQFAMRPLAEMGLKNSCPYSSAAPESIL